MVKKSKNIFEKRNPFSNLNNEKTKNFVKQLEEDENIKTEVLKIKGAEITSINEKILRKIDFSDREFINREITFEKIMETEALRNLAESINEIGIINPVYVIRKENGKYKILSGFRRLSAVYYGYENIKDFNPAGTNNLIIIPENAGYEILDKISLHENTLREDLTTLEISMKIWRESRNKKKNAEQIAQEYGISKRTVARYLRVEKYPEQLLEKLDEIKNIRKSDTIFNYLNRTNFENMEKNIEKLSAMEISDIEREIKKLALTVDDNKIIVKKGKKSTSFEIQGRLTDEEIEKIKQIISKRILI
ncbi:ParB/RepB/Spo0J family partition protein [Pseudoleptotrichia goodfellowii]|jgi:putative partitioning protein|uniref:ParB-like protein n=1 Tax=Pseudoleptotrichia goodfellowii F0264 TaxID=596323 RepID=D0GKU3_9FUSO|nr:ParB/RepB/Spo0J family partition protein [Pseudoleptotrichia goodfellowii]EEY35292.1 ParB-like protein [Pseudoleptotrichia goodfellowii F0264]